MRWLRAILRPAGAAAAPATGRPPDLVASGFDEELRGDFDRAQNLYRQALDADEESVEARHFLGVLALRDQRVDEAIALFEAARARFPGEATYALDLGNALRAALRHEEALAAFEACLRLAPECLEARVNRAVSLIELNRREEARVELERLREEFPAVPEIYFNLAGIYREYARIDDAIDAYRRVQQLRPGHAPAHSNLLLMLHYSARYDAETIWTEHRRFGELFSRRYIAPPVDPRAKRRIRLAYISPDFRSHVVTYFIEPALANHDRERFEVFCYYTRPDKDVVTERLRGHVEHWVDCEDLDDEELAEKIRSDGIDILVELAGHTGHNALKVLAMKPAPIQGSYLGYPDTTGLSAMDFRLTDALADPPGDADRRSAERLVRLPHTYFCYRPAAKTPAVSELPALASGAVTFGCFNNFHKITDVFLEAVARVLEAVPRSRFVLKGRPLSVPEIANGVREHFARRGIAQERIELRSWEAGFKEHLAIYQSIDVALDSFPYNGATTTCEALWMGVPVVTVPGDRHAARVGASLLNAVGLARLVARDIDQYVEIAASLARDIAALAQLRRGLREQMRRSPLMDEPGFARNLEHCYGELWEEAKRESASHGTRSPMSAGPQNEPPHDLLEEARRRKAAGELPLARAACEALLGSRPDDPQALALLWDLGFDSGRPGIALDALLRALELQPGCAEFHHMLGCVLQAQGKITDAVEAFRRALQIDPRLGKSHNNIGCLFESTGGLDEAIRCYRAAIAADPDLIEASYNLGNAYKSTGALEQAIVHMASAVARQPDRADWQSNLGEIYLQQARLDDALACFRAACDANPGAPLGLVNLAMAQVAVGDLDAAQAALSEALKPGQRQPQAESLQLCLSQFAEGDAEAQRRQHALWNDRHVLPLVRMTEHPRLRSADERPQRVGYLLSGEGLEELEPFLAAALASHVDGGPEAYCYVNHAIGKARDFALAGGCTAWRDISLLSDHQAANRIRADGVDLLVDLAGHAIGGRPLVVGRKPAAVQAAWLGYPGSSGIGSIDYRLTDAIADPPDADSALPERLLRLEGGIACYTPASQAPLPDAPNGSGDGILRLGYFAPLACLSTEAVAAWARLLETLPGARMLVGSPAIDQPAARTVLLRRLRQRGIDGSRVEFAGRTGLKRYALADIVVDGFPRHGLRATCEALWMGVPVLTLAGAQHRSRLGVSLLRRAGLDAFVTQSVGALVDAARVLAADDKNRARLRARLREQLRGSPLTDAAAFGAALQEAYRRMWTLRRRAVTASTGEA